MGLLVLLLPDPYVAKTLSAISCHFSTSTHFLASCPSAVVVLAATGLLLLMCTN